ncbi:TTF-type zinc finger protein with HAT dimerisation domain, partial [Prunus dulcis]
MERYFKRRFASTTSSSDNVGSSSSRDVDISRDVDNPGLRPQMLDYDPNIRDEVRRAYLQKGPCQPKDHTFPQTDLSGYDRRFNVKWFDEFDWLEYSISKDAAFCLYCYLFKSNFRIGQGCSDAFTEMGFRNWKKKDKIRQHVGPVGSVHNQSRQYCVDLMNQKQHIRTALIKQSEQARIDYRICLTASLDCVRFLLRQGLPFRGHDESDTSSNKGNYLELLQFLADHDEKVKAVVLENAPGNLKLIAPTIQKDLVNACATETIKKIIKDMDGAFFSLLVDESRDVSVKEQMAVVFRYVDKSGDVIERFVGIQHVRDTTSNSLKEAIDILFAREELSISMLRGQGYDGASNMKGEFNGLKTQILRENPCAYYIHCFAHQLQLALVAVAKGNADIATFFTSCNSLVNIVGASCKRHDILRDQLQKDVTEALEKDTFPTGRGLNQETCLKRPVIHVGTHIMDGSTDNLGEANRSLREIQSFEFVFHLFFMRSILGATNDLSQALQRKDQDIENAMTLVKVCKDQLQHMRENAFEALLDQVSSFCAKHDILVPNMDDAYVAQWRSHRRAPIITHLHHYRVDIFIQIIEWQLAELNRRFSEVNTELLLCLTCLSPDDSFIAFDKQKLLRFAEFYPQDFNSRDLLALEDQLEIYITHMRTMTDFSQLKGIGSLARKMVEKGLALTLPVATASVERAFSAMNIVKGPLRNRMGDQWLSDSLLVYIEKDTLTPGRKYPGSATSLSPTPKVPHSIFSLVLLPESPKGGKEALNCCTKFIQMASRGFLGVSNGELMRSQNIVPRSLGWAAWA